MITSSVQTLLLNGGLTSRGIHGGRFPHEQRSEMPDRLEGIVGTTPELKISGDCLSSVGEWHDMVYLQEAAFCAPTLCPDERALATVTIPHRATDRRGYIPRMRIRGSR